MKVSRMICYNHQPACEMGSDAVDIYFSDIEEPTIHWDWADSKCSVLRHSDGLDWEYLQPISIPFVDEGRLVYQTVIIIWSKKQSIFSVVRDSPFQIEELAN